MLQSIDEGKQNYFSKHDFESLDGEKDEEDQRALVFSHAAAPDKRNTQL